MSYGRPIRAGDWVEYTRPGCEPERGTAIRWNDSGTLVFVRFGRERGEALPPEHLRRVTE